MNTPATPKPEGLRARKRRATENAIENSAVDLALEHGVDQVTVEAICEMADISRSTFFNYFASRDSAIVGRSISFPDGDDAFEVLDSSADNLPFGIYRLYFAAVGHRHVNTDVARKRMQLMTEQPDAARMTLVALLESSYQLTTAAATWLVQHPEHAKLSDPLREATLAVTLVNGVITVNMADWLLKEGDIETAEAEFETALQEFRTLIG